MQECLSSRKYQIAGYHFDLRKNGELCRCGYPDAQVAEGIFDLSHEVVKVLRADDITYLMLENIALAAARVESDEISVERGIEQIREHNPRLAQIVQKGMKYGKIVFAVIGALAAVAGIDMYVRSDDTMISDAWRSVWTSSAGHPQ